MLENEMNEVDGLELIFEFLFWCNKGWIVWVIKNDDDDGWVVVMIMDGEFELVLVGLWMMGCDKKNLKLFDVMVFGMLVKMVLEVVCCYEYYLYVMFYKKISVSMDFGIIIVSFDIVVDEDDFYVMFSVCGSDGEEIGWVCVELNFKFNLVSVMVWIDDEFC